MHYLLAATAPGGNMHYATDTWNGGAVILLLIIVLLVIRWLRS